MQHTASDKKKGCAGLVPPSPLILTLCQSMASAAQLPQATVAGRRGCNYPPKRTVTDVRRPGKHEATVRDPITFRVGGMDSTGTEHYSRSFLSLSDAGSK